MSQGQIMQAQPTRSPLEGIAQALQIAHSIYGIKSAGIQAQALQQQVDKGGLALKQAQDAANPDSPMSDLARKEQTATDEYLSKQGFDTSALASALKGKPAVAAVQDQDYPAPSDGIGPSGVRPGTPGQEAIPPMSAAQLAQNSEMSPILSLAKSQMQAEAMARAAGLRAGSYSDKNLGTLSGQYETALTPFKNIQNDIGQIESVLNTKDKNGKPLVSSQQLGDANAAISRVFSPNHMSDSTVSRTEYESVPAQFSAAIQKYLANPTDIGSRDLLNHIVDQAHHIGNVANQNAIRQLDSLDTNIPYVSEPQVQQALAAKSSQFRKQFGKKYPEMGSGSGEGQPDGQAPANKPKVVYQGGHMYQLNEATGKYE